MLSVLQPDRLKSVPGVVRRVYQIIVIIITLSFPAPGLNAQAIQIKNEVSFGTPGFDFGNHRVIIADNGDIVTLSQYKFDSSNHKQWQISRFNKQMVLLTTYVTTLTVGNIEVNSFIQTSDNGFAIIGSVELTRQDGRKDYDIRINKLSSSGIFQWEKNIGGNGNDKAVGIQQTANGGYFIIANTFSTDADFQNNSGKSQVWLGKLDANGNKTSGGLLTSFHANEAADFIKTPDGRFAICGNERYDQLIQGYGRGEAFVRKILEDGKLSWGSITGGPADDEKFLKMAVDPAGNIIVVGSGQSDYNPSGINTGVNGYIFRIGVTGFPSLLKQIGGSGVDELRAVTVAANGIITVGGSTTSRDGQMSDNVYGHSIWISSLRPDGSALRQGYFGHADSDPSSIEDIITAPDGNIYCVANSNAANIFMKKPLGQTDGWLINLGQKNTVIASVFIDVNSNGKQDVSEKLFTTGKFEITNINIPGVKEYLFSNKGKYEAMVDTGSFLFRFVSDQPYYNVNPENKSFSFKTYDLADNLVIALSPIATKNDLEINIIPGFVARPGFDLSYILQYANRGTTNANNPAITFVKDPRITFLSAIPAPASIKGDTITWQPGLLSPLDSGQIVIRTQVKAPPVTSIGDTLLAKVTIMTDFNDETIDNNSSTVKQIVTGSYDPNDKTEFQAGILSLAALATESSLYRIRFQNTGTDTAFNIIIRDTLHSNLETGSLRMISASHGYKLDIKPYGELQWTFNNIKLADSNVNEKASHGYVLYSIKPKSTLVEGDVITNRASIYFDFNLPIVTNTTLTKITDIIALPRPILTGLQQIYCGAAASQIISIGNASNAGNAIITVKIDDIPIVVDVAGEFMITPSTLKSGVHIISVSFTMNTAIANLTTQFTVSNPVTPVVKLTANVSIVTDDTAPLIFMAENLGGGGNLPLYTLSNKRDFSAVIQSESQLNTWMITSQNMKPGDNWIYTRMKTSENCYTSLNSIDSIKVVRLAVTSIVDTNFPTNIISAYPNPFRSDITIRGLQSSVSYVTQIIDAIGNVVRTNNVEGKTSVTYYNLDLPNGKYFIKLYDKRRKRLIGTLPVLRL
jgi:hypothetical protein